MKKFIGMFFVLVSILAYDVFAQLPPVIDREVFFGDPEISGAQISPDGNYITFLKPFNNVRNIWIKERGQKFEEARPLTNDTKRPISGYFWSQDSKYVLFVQDQGGNENYRVYAVDPATKGDPVPAARDLTPLDKVRAMIIDVPKDSPDEIIIGLNDRNPQLHDVYKINLVSGERKLLRENNDNIAGWVTDLKGNLKLGVRQTPDGGTEILKLDGDKLSSIYSVTSDETAGPVRFTPDGNSFYMITNKGDKLDKTQLVLFDMKTGMVKLIEKDPLNEVDFGSAVFSDVTNELLATVYVGDKVRIYPKQKKFAADYEKLTKAVPEGNLSLSSMTQDENIWMVGVSRDVDPGSMYLFDRKTGKAELLYKSRPDLPTEYLASMKPVKYTARDGFVIHGYLTLPKGIPAKNLPVIMFIHGGPWARDMWGYSSIPQFLANRGYAVLQPNFRGSTGYGKKFLNAGNKEWGKGTMQHDITDGVEWLIKEGIADPKRVAIAGGSYGGYATLAGLAFTPDLYAAGFDIVGPSNIITLLNSIPPYWAPIKKTFDIRVGDMNDPQEKKMLEDVSPLNSAGNIKAPLYVVQGANDPRVNKAESDQIIVALRQLGRQVEYMVAPDEGHGFAGKENRLAMFTAMEKFLAKHLGGRVEEKIQPDIQKKLDEITVDINSVKLPEKKESAGESKTIGSFDGSKIQPVTLKYKMKIEARGQKFDMDVHRSVSKSTLEGKEVIVAIDATSGMMGGNDTLYVDAATLRPVKRDVKQGMATVHINFKPDLVEGQIEAGPQKMPINVKIDKPVFSEGTGIELGLLTLDLKEGMKVSVDQLNIMSGKVSPTMINVVGKEKVKIDADEFDTFKVELSSSDGGASQTLWIDPQMHAVVKAESKLGPQMGGGTVILELVK